MVREDELCGGMDGWPGEVLVLARGLLREADGDVGVAVRRLMRREPGMREREARELVSGA